MPTYEYACRSCGSQLEVVQSFTDDALTTCGECGGPLRKVFGAVGISFKGSGFYKTDSRKGSSSSSSSASSSSTEGAGKEAKGAKESKTKEPAAASSSSSSSDTSSSSTPSTPKSGTSS